MSYHTVQQRLKICAYNQQPWLQNLCSKHMRTGEHVHGQTVAVAGLGAAPGPVLVVQPLGVCGALSALLPHPCLQSLTWGGGGGVLPAPAQPPPSPCGSLGWHPAGDGSLSNAWRVTFRLAQERTVISASLGGGWRGGDLCCKPSRRRNVAALSGWP